MRRCAFSSLCRMQFAALEGCFPVAGQQVAMGWCPSPFNAPEWGYVEGDSVIVDDVAVETLL